VIVDVSKHAGVTDDGALRGRILERLLRAMPGETTAGVWTYARYVNLLVRHEPADELWKQIAAIHARNLAAAGEAADFGKALRAATWDLGEQSSSRRHVILVTSGVLSVPGATDAEAEQALLNGWVAALAQSNITVHVLKLGANEPSDVLRQIADVSGGLRASVADGDAADRVTLDLIDLIALRGQALVDEAGRFQVEPGTTEVTALWMNPDTDAKLVQPDGKALDGMTPIADGRWLIGRDFVMASIRDPQVGWWQVQGMAPDRIGVFADLAVRVDGTAGGVVPTDESAATISLFSRGQLVDDLEFLDLLDVRAWVLKSGDRVPLPIERKQFAFAAFFVNLEDGPQHLEVQVTGPTFQRRVRVPFVVHNPLQVEIARAPEGGHTAWIQFSHAMVDYGSVRVSAKVRKAPQPAQIVPALKSPAGLWKASIDWSEGILEATFSISGNYLNKEGFFLKTKPINVSLPAANEAPLVFTFDAEGNHTQAATAPVEDTPVASSMPAPSASAPEPMGTVAPTSEPTEEGPLIPIWFAGLIALLNLAVAAFVWWIFKPKPLPASLQPAAA
jgi:hypothetical protein